MTVTISFEEPYRSIEQQRYNQAFEITHKQKDYLKFSILNTIFCFWFLGIPALICSLRARNKFRKGETFDAIESASSAKLFNIIGIAMGSMIGITTVLITFILFFNFT